MAKNRILTDADLDRIPWDQEEPQTKNLEVLATSREELRRQLWVSQSFPKIVTLCGSTRFKQEFIDANFQMTRQGIIVLSVGWFSHADGEVFTPTVEQKAAFDELHLRKIDLSDGIYVVNPYCQVCPNCRAVTKTHVKRGMSIHIEKCGCNAEIGT